MAVSPEPFDDLPETRSGVVLEEALPELKPPCMYQVLLYNDDFTPMDFVVEVLKLFFFKPQAVAQEMMLRIHTTGKVVCGIYTKNVAETKVLQVRKYSIEHEHPLRCDMQALD